MNKQTLDQFRAHARDVRLPEGVRRSVLAEATAEKGRDSRRRGITRRAAVGVGLGALGTAAALLALSVVTRPDERQGDGAAGNWFALRAYAEGTSQGSDTVLSSFIGTASSMGGGDDGSWYTARSIDLACAGSNIASVTCALEGDRVSAVGQPDDPVTEPWVWLDALYNHRDRIGQGEALPSGGDSFTSFTVAFDDLAADEEDFNRQIWVTFPTDDEVEAASTRAHADGSTDEDYARYQALLERRSANVLAGVTFSLTATFADGSTLTKRYGIAPRDDFDEVCLAHYENPEATSDPQLFVITELDA